MVVVAVDWFILSDRIFAYVFYFVTVARNDSISSLNGVENKPSVFET
jgi:hypothetical protein